jgi:hypothetical protein
MTNYVHRILIIAREDRVAGIVTWFQNNLGATSVPSNLGPGLSPTGSNPATYRWMCGSYTNLECREIIKRMCVVASVTPPTNAQWAGWTGAQQREFLAGVRNTIWSNFNVWVQLADNENVWDNVEAALTARGMQRITL